MSAFKEILEWSESGQLPEWQRDSLRRLISKGIAPSDIDDLTALLKSEHGIQDDKGRTAEPLSSKDIPDEEFQSTPVKLLQVKNLTNVNAIAENTEVEIAENGLSIIYGDNGSGKSGYCRVLKKACRARDRDDEIQPNTNSEGAVSGPPSAEFDVEIEEDLKTLIWKDDTESPPELSAIQVFDARCARAYLDSEGDYSFIPYGMDVFDGLVSICGTLREKIDADLDALPVPALPEGLMGESTVGVLVSRLPSEEAMNELKKLWEFSEKDKKKLEQLIATVKTVDPLKKATALKSLRETLSRIVSQLDDSTKALTGVELDNLKTLRKDYETKQAAAKIASNLFKNEKFVDSTGSDEWRVLFEAAEAFVSSASFEKSLKQFEAGDPCPLCQQHLDDDAAARLHLFHKHINDSAETDYKKSRQALATTGTQLKEKRFPSIDAHTMAAIGHRNEELPESVSAYIDSLRVLRDSTVKAFRENEWTNLPELNNSPIPSLKQIIENLTTEIKSLVSAHDPKKLSGIALEISELQTRKLLSESKASLVSHADVLTTRKKLEACRSALATTQISKKASQVAEQIVTQVLKDKLNEEFSKLGANNLQVESKPRASKGTIVHKLVLNTDQSVPPSRILSEGEQRAIALGAFLAESSLSGNTNAVVFDDPVTSLDHKRKAKIAKRLVDEASQRQVIVLTHDITFLLMLDEESAKQTATPNMQMLTRTSAGYGVPVEDIPFQGKRSGARIGMLNAAHQQIVALANKGEEEERIKLTQKAYRDLRDTWERTIEEVLLNETVLRFRRGVETNRLRCVTVSDDDFKKIEENMAKASQVYSHDNSPELGNDIPDPDTLKTDIDTLSAWRAEVIERNKTIGKSRS